MVTDCFFRGSTGPERIRPRKHSPDKPFSLGDSMAIHADDLARTQQLFQGMTADLRTMRADLNAFTNLLLPYFEEHEAPRDITDAANAFTSSLRAASLSSDACGKAFTALVEKLTSGGEE